MADVVARNIRENGSSRMFLDGSGRAVVALQSVAIGRGEYLPGWRWSVHAGPQTATAPSVT